MISHKYRGVFHLIFQKQDCLYERQVQRCKKRTSFNRAHEKGHRKMAFFINANGE